jgi:hypothetical protein
MSMKQWSKSWGRSLLAMIASSAGIVSAEGVRYYHVKPKQQCGIPPLQIASNAANLGRRVKEFQFIPTALQIDHCSISRIALFIEDNGHWRLSLQADQNPLVEESTALTTVLPSTTLNTGLPAPGKPALPTAPIRGLPAVRLKHTTFLKRNLFVIRVRGLGDFAEPIAVPPAPPALGKPVLLSLPSIEFWVQNGVQLPLVREGYHEDAITFFDLIDRAEIEFSYR